MMMVIFYFLWDWMMGKMKYHHITTLALTSKVNIGHSQCCTWIGDPSFYIILVIIHFLYIWDKYFQYTDYITKIKFILWNYITRSFLRFWTWDLGNRSNGELNQLSQQVCFRCYLVLINYYQQTFSFKVKLVISVKNYYSRTDEYILNL